ncbi:hypothetical protein RUND412_005728 [Rhizina undulata]
MTNNDTINFFILVLLCSCLGIYHIHSIILSFTDDADLPPPIYNPIVPGEALTLMASMALWTRYLIDLYFKVAAGLLGPLLVSSSHHPVHPVPVDDQPAWVWVLNRGFRRRWD